MITKYKVILCFLLMSLGVAAQTLFQDIRLGFMKNDIHDIRIRRRYEKGYNFNVELLTSPLTQNFWSYLFSPQIHTGFSINSHGGTHHLYGGLTWRFSLGPILIEPSFGPGFNTAKHKHPSRRRQALGSSFLFRESVGVGYLFPGTDFSAYLYVDHVSNAHLARPNPGLTSFGIRLGYKLSC